MPPRISLSSVIRQSTSILKTHQQIKQFSILPALQALKNPNAQLLNIDLDAGSPQRSSIGSDVLSILDTRKTTQPTKQKAPGRLELFQEMSDKAVAADHLRQMPRRWRDGDVYAPHDLSPREAQKWRRITSRQQDLVDLLGLNPLDMYRNFSFISEYTTSHGRIKRSEMTGLRPVNQRKVAKAIRRAIGLGLHPSVHKHPEILAHSKLKQLVAQDSVIGALRESIYHRQ